MDIQRVFFVLGGFEIIFGAALTLWPDAAPQILGWAAMLIGVATVLYGIFGWESGLSVKWMESTKFQRNDGFPPFRRLIRLKEAARLAYEHTTESMAARMAERPVGDEKPNPLGWYSYALLGSNNKGVEVYGRKPASQKLEVIPAQQFPQLGFSDDLNSVHCHGESYPEYVDLYVPASDLKKRIKEIRGW